MRQRDPRQKNEKHLAFIRTLPCLVCRHDIGVDAAHIRFADRRVAKRPTGLAEKPHDRFTVPLCRECHTKQHSQNEQKFWDSVKATGRVKDGPIFVALALWGATGDHEAGEQIIQEQH